MPPGLRHRDFAAQDPLSPTARRLAADEQEKLRLQEDKRKRKEVEEAELRKVRMGRRFVSSHASSNPFLCSHRSPLFHRSVSKKRMRLRECRRRRRLPRRLRRKGKGRK